MSVSLKQLFTSISNLATEVGKEIKKLNQKTGETSSLETTNKSSLVAAINEIKTAVDDKSELTIDTVRNTLIVDGSRSSDATYSSQKIEDLITSKVDTAKTEVKSDILDGAEEAYDTLKELQDKIKSGDSAVNGILDALGKRLRTDEVMSLDDTAQQNIAGSLGLENIDYVAVFKAALN